MNSVFSKFNLVSFRIRTSLHKIQTNPESKSANQDFHRLELQVPALYAYNVGMRSKHTIKSVQLTVRGVPSTVKNELANRAKKQNKSLNNILVELLCTAAGHNADPLNHDLDYLAGTWVDDPEFDSVVQDFDKIDQDMWK